MDNSQTRELDYLKGPRPNPNQPNPRPHLPTFGGHPPVRKPALLHVCTRADQQEAQEENSLISSPLWGINPPPLPLHTTAGALDRRAGPHAHATVPVAPVRPTPSSCAGPCPQAPARKARDTVKAHKAPADGPTPVPMSSLRPLRQRGSGDPYDLHEQRGRNTHPNTGVPHQYHMRRHAP